MPQQLTDQANILSHFLALQVKQRNMFAIECTKSEVVTQIRRKG